MHHTTLLIAQRRTGREAARRRAHGRVDPLLARRLALGLAALLLLAGLAWLASRLSFDAPQPKRQVARIALMPDTPPPPPPPPPKEPPKEAPTPQARPQPRPDEAPKPPAPANEALKMEGAAGNGPSAFAAGTVNSEYRGGSAATGAAGGGLADRAAERLYANSVRQLLQAEIERRLGQETGEFSASLSLWIAADGRITRWESDGAGDTERQALRTAMEASAQSLRLPAPPAIAQPMRFRLTLRAGA